MIKKKTITTDKATLLVVGLPEEAINIYIHQGFIHYETFGLHKFRLPDGIWQLLGRLPDITEEQAESVLPDYYHNHIMSFAKLYWALLFDFLNDKEVYFENPLGEEAKIYPSDRYEDGLERTWKSQLDFQEAQSKVWDRNRTYLFKKI